MRAPRRAPREDTKAADELILLCAGTEARRAALRPRAERLLATIDMDSVARRLKARGLLATLGPRVLQLAGACSSEAFAVAVRDEIAAGRRRDTLLQFTARQVTAALAERNVRTSVLKGPALGEAIYREPGRRRSRDVDLLVGEESLPEAVAVVRELGYLPPNDRLEPEGLPALHFALAHARNQLPPVELHWRIHWYERGFAGTRLLAPLGLDPMSWRPAAVDDLAALLLFYARDGFVGLKLATDLAAWWDSRGTEVAPGAVEALVDEHAALAPAIVTALRVAQITVGLPAERIMPLVERHGVRERIAIGIAEPTPRSSTAQLYAQMSLVDWLLAPRARGQLGALVRRHLLLPRASAFGDRSARGHAERSSSSIGHASRVLARYCLTVGRLLIRRAPGDRGPLTSTLGRQPPEGPRLR